MSDDEVRKIDVEVEQIERQIRKLSERKVALIKKREALNDRKFLEASVELGERKWECEKFDWSEDVQNALVSIFKIPSFRAQQLAAINATMSKEHAIVVMPTGAGKSLCYQLPAVVEKGITVVISPLVSLMEDQIMSLSKKNVTAIAITASSTKEATDLALNAMTDDSSDIRLLYATPERLAKSKRFMAKLQKCFAAGRLARIAIDEVHCCSQWGHDFRPDYKFLGVLSSMFPGVPVLGLTATATAQVLIDVQKMLDIRGCLIIKSDFDRPNLYYRVVEKPSSSDECADALEKMLKTRFAGETGIIYAMSVKECEDLAQALRDRGVKVACYHANLEPARRSAIHAKWSEKHYQAVVATVAFGLGIDKPDVRFVIHHSLSKAMESYYQESGRAGRDGLPAECVTMFRMQDVFRTSSLVFSTVGSVDRLYGMVKYCLEPSRCRRDMIGEHFEERASVRCHRMCDRCDSGNSHTKKISLAKCCRDLYKIIDHASDNDTKLTAQKLIEAWYGKGPVNLRVKEVPAPKMSRNEAERAVVFLLVEGYLKEDFHFTSYNTISYLKKGRKQASVAESSFALEMTINKVQSMDEISSKRFSCENGNDKRKSNPESDSDDDVVLKILKKKTKLEVNENHKKGSSELIIID